MKQQAHYSDTSEMLQAFFAKPLTLVLAISFAFTALAQIVIPLISGGEFTCDVFSICFSIGFFLLYFKANSRDPFVNFKAPLTLIKVAAIVSTCLIGCVFVLLLVCIPMLTSLESLMPSFVSTFKILFIVFGALLIVYFVFNLGFSLFVGSMKKTLKTNTVKRTGSVLTGVSGIVFLLSCIGYIFVLFLMAELIISAFTEVFSLLLEESLYSTGSDIAYTSLANTSNSFAPSVYSCETVDSSSEILDLSILVAPALSFINIVLTSVYALCYNSFMKKAEKNFVPSAPVPPSSNSGSASSFGFSSQPTYSSQSYSSPSSPSSYNNPPRNNFGGPAVPATMNYSRALAPEIHFGDEFNANEDRRICPTCGSKVELSLDFCPQCGFKFIIKDETPVEKDPEPVVEPVIPAASPVVEPVAPAPAPIAEPVVPTPAPAVEPFAPTPAPAVEPFAPTPAPAVEPFAPTPAPAAEPVVPTPAPVAEPFASTPAPVAEPFAPTPAPVAEPFVPTPAPVAEPFAPTPAPAVEPFVPTPAPVVEPVQPKAPTAFVEQPFVAPFQTVDTVANQPSVSEQPLVNPFFNSNMQPSRSRSRSRDDDGPKPIITNSNLKR